MTLKISIDDKNSILYYSYHKQYMLFIKTHPCFTSCILFSNCWSLVNLKLNGTELVAKYTYSLSLMYRFNHRVCNFHVILLWLMLLRDHFLFRFLYFTTAGVKCQVASVKSCPVIHFSGVIFFWSFGIIDASTIKCCIVYTGYVLNTKKRNIIYSRRFSTLYPSIIFFNWMIIVLIYIWVTFISVGLCRFVPNI
jgi:hypothetical protein